jgi:hypothetical protein
VAVHRRRQRAGAFLVNLNHVQIEALARHRAVEKMQPGYWIYVEVDVEGRDGATEWVWGQVCLIMEVEQITTGKRIVRMSLTDPAAEGEDRGITMAAYRGESRLSLTQRQGVRCGFPTDADK